MAGISPKTLRSENARLTCEVEELRLRLDEAEQGLEAIRTGQAESLIVEGPDGPRIFSLEGADHSYRVLVEAMNEGAATFGEDGTVLYCNARFAEMLEASLERVMGGAIGRFISEHSRSAFEALVRETQGGESRGELELRSQGGKLVPAYVSVSVINDDTHRVCCLVATDLRAQKRNQEILAAERLAGSVLEQAADAIVVCDENGRIIRASNSAVDLCASNPLRMPFEQALPLELSAGDTGGASESLLAKAMRGELLRAVPASLTLRDGTRADLLASATSLRGADDRILGYVVTLVDVTDLRQTEGALREALTSAEDSGQLLEAMMENIPLGITIAASPDVRLRRVSRHGRELLQDRNEGLTVVPAEKPQGTWGVYHADGVTLATPDELPLTRATQKGELVQGEEWLVARRDGVKIPIYCTAAPIRDGKGRITGGVAAWQDISERKRAEEALWHSREAYRALADNAPDSVDRLDRESRHLYVNAVAASLLGKTPAEVIGKTNRELGVPDPAAGNWEQRIRAIFENGEPADFEDSFPAVGGVRFFHTRCVPERSSDGRVASVMTVSRDVTERKQAEETVRKANLRLAEADQRKTEFLAMLSHELRNPLAPISNSLFILERAPPGGELATRAMQVVARQVGHLTNLVNELLEVTRITRGKIQLQKERLDLADVTGWTVEDNRSVFDRAGVRLELTLASKPAPVLADRTRLAQVVGNLLQNAAKFTTDGGCARVSVAAEGSEAVLRVADDGVGIGSETLSRLFEPFTQADQTLDRSKGGLGLGLSLVRGLVELHGGSVSAHSGGLGRGTEVVVRLPLDTGAAAEPAAAADRAPRGRRRILIVEDNVDAANSLREALEMSEHEVLVAYNGPEGIAKAREFRPEVVLCDIGLPGMDGCEVAGVFRADDALKGAFLVALSGYAMPEDLQRAAQAGFERHLAKPPSLEKLEQLLAEVPALR